jgi:hypothetical protein
MDILKKYKLMLIDPINYPFPEWILCEELLGILGKIEENKDVYIDDKYVYYYDSKKGIFYLSYKNIWSFFENKFNMEHTDIQQVTSIYVEKTYNLKGINTCQWLRANYGKG